jgi:hypothetical protein
MSKSEKSTYQQVKHLIKTSQNLQNPKFMDDALEVSKIQSLFACPCDNCNCSYKV